MGSNSFGRVGYIQRYNRHIYNPSNCRNKHYNVQNNYSDESWEPYRTEEHALPQTRMMAVPNAWGQVMYTRS